MSALGRTHAAPITSSAVLLELFESSAARKVPSSPHKLPLVYAEAVGEPVEHILLADGRVVVLAVLRAGLLFAKQLQGRMPGETLANGAASLLGLPESTPELEDIQWCSGQWCQPKGS
jgi:hypothetical protein